MAVGQFDDALEYPTKALEQAPVFDPREGRSFIDDPLLQWSDGEDDDLELSYDEDSEDAEYEDVRLANVDNEDWEIAERGEFCRRY
jgi:RIO kinase 1